VLSHACGPRRELISIGVTRTHTRSARLGGLVLDISALLLQRLKQEVEMMMRRAFSLAVMVLVTLLSAACSESDCATACEAAKKCDPVPARFALFDCGDGCDFYENQAETAGCDAELEAFDACGADNVDRACEETVCNAEADALSACLTK
jgi:hypothetical protein